MHHFTIEHTLHTTALGAFYERSFHAQHPAPSTRRRASLVRKCSSLTTHKHMPETLSDTAAQALDNPVHERAVVARLIAYGGHNHVAQCYDHITTQDPDTGDASVCIVSEYWNGGDLVACLPTSGDLGERVVIAILQQVASGILFLHTRLGVAHRGLSLENVVLRDGVCKVAHFGLATPLEQK